MAAPETDQVNRSESESCIACGTSSWREFSPWRRPQIRVLQCRGCQLTRSSELVSGAQEEVGDAKSSRTEPAFHQAILSSYEDQTQQAARLVPERLKAYSKLLGRDVESVLEIGCGTAQYFDAYAKAGVDWVGTEVNPAMVQHAESIGAPLQDLAELVASGTTFDVVFMSQVMEHILDPAAIFDDIRAVLAPGGLVHLDVPNHDSLVSAARKHVPFGPDYGFIQPPHHLVAYNVPSLTALLRSNGLQPVDVRAVSNTDPVFGQLVSKSSIKDHVLDLAGRVGRGSLLMGIARAKA